MQIGFSVISLLCSIERIMLFFSFLFFLMQEMISV